MTRIYFDNAATSWPKPPAVYDAIDRYMREEGAPAGRGSYAQAEAITRQIEVARLKLAEFIGVLKPEQIVWTYSGTDSLHVALHGLLRKGDHVVTSDVEHNSILRPLRQLEDEGMIRVSRVACEASGLLSAEKVLSAVEKDTRLVALSHASNVTGIVQPLPAIGAALAQSETAFLVDAAQTIGHCPVSVNDLQCDLLAAPGHKGLLGPTGTGFLYIAEHLNDSMRPVRLGGTGTSSESDLPPMTMPHRFEAGNLNVLGIMGISAGLDFLEAAGVAKLQAHELLLTRQLYKQLRDMESIHFAGAIDGLEQHQKLGVVSFNVAEFAPDEVAVLLDEMATIQVRAGFHCSPNMHRALQTDAMGGTVRVSFGPFNTADEVTQLLTTLEQLTGG